MCGAVYLPERHDIRGEALSPIVCTANPQFDNQGAPIQHRGKHRTNLPGGTRLRWSDEETEKA